VALIALTIAIPFLPFAGLLGFVPLPGALMLMLLGVTLLYVAATEVAKRIYYRSALERG
jgi:Mg2+-importing ATPase